MGCKPRAVPTPLGRKISATERNESRVPPAHDRLRIAGADFEMSERRAFQIAEEARAYGRTYFHGILLTRFVDDLRNLAISPAEVEFVLVLLVNYDRRMSPSALRLVLRKGRRRIYAIGQRLADGLIDYQKYAGYSAAPLLARWDVAPDVEQNACPKCRTAPRHACSKCQSLARDIGRALSAFNARHANMARSPSSVSREISRSPR